MDPSQRSRSVLRQKYFLNGPHWNKPVLRNRNTRRAFTGSHLLPRGDSKMTRHDQELLEKELWTVSSHPRNSAIIGLTIIAVFLAGIGIGDILSKSKQANTNYGPVIFRVAEAPQ